MPDWLYYRKAILVGVLVGTALGIAQAIPHMIDRWL